LVGRVLLCGVVLRGLSMQIFEDIKVEGKYIIVFDFDEWALIRLEALRSGRIITKIVESVLVYGVRHYKYSPKR